MRNKNKNFVISEKHGSQILNDKIEAFMKGMKIEQLCFGGNR